MGGDQNEEVNLVELDFAENNFTGNIPNDFGKLIKLTWLKLFMNKFFWRNSTNLPSMSLLFLVDPVGTEIM
jgi:hypothetical protein